MLDFSFVLESLVVNSTQSMDCSGLNSLRKKGHILGSYSCQGKTLPIGSTGRPLSGSLSATSLVGTVFMSSMLINWSI